MLVDQQWLWKENRALARRLQSARLKERGVIEDIDYQHPRGPTASCWAHSRRVNGHGRTRTSCSLDQPILRHSELPRYTSENIDNCSLLLT